MGRPSPAQGLVQGESFNQAFYNLWSLYYPLGSVFGASDLSVNKMQTLPSWSPQFGELES